MGPPSISFYQIKGTMIDHLQDYVTFTQYTTVYIAYINI